MSHTRLIAGAMSGTSADGVDVAIVEVGGRGLEMTAKPLSHAYEPFPAELRKRILEVRQQGEVRLDDLAEIGRRVTLAHVPAFRAACAQVNVTADQVEAIAAHGQTLYHGPPNTIQYFDPSLLAYETGCAVVSDFRRADLAAGGQGAPLVPFADWILFRHPSKSRVILNIGGIANITYLKAGGGIDEVIAFDTGPGNCWSDWLCRTLDPDGPGYDRDGAIASRGDLVTFWIEHFLTDAVYFQRPPPKTTDGPEMIALYEDVARERADELPRGIEDTLFCANRIAAGAILLAVKSLPSCHELLVAGGGVENQNLMEQLAELFDHPAYGRVAPKIRRTGELGIATDAREAIAFALLGAATLDGEPSNVPSATGASRRVVLGSITPRPV